MQKRTEESILQSELVLSGVKLSVEKDKDKVLSEREVLERVQRGEKEAYQWIVLKYMKQANYIALGFIHNQQDALDISQEAFIRAFRKIRSFNTHQPFFPWFYQIVRNLCLDSLKRKRQRAEIPLDEVKIFKEDSSDREMKEVLWKGINSLSLEQKEVIILYYFQQFSYKEISETTGRPMGTVMSSLYYAKKRLKEKLSEFLCLSEEE